MMVWDANAITDMKTLRSTEPTAGKTKQQPEHLLAFWNEGSVTNK